jgi:hypothetical protein
MQSASRFHKAKSPTGAERDLERVRADEALQNEKKPHQPGRAQDCAQCRWGFQTKKPDQLTGRVFSYN